MSKKTRILILIFCVLCFFVASPILISYSMGYRFDFEKMKVVETGGIYVRTFPTADQIIVDSGAPEKPGFLSNFVFIQSLLPKNHTVLVKKEGYFDYTKTLPVEEGMATKIENVLLFKKKPAFSELSKEAKSPFLPPAPGRFSIKDGNLYYSETPTPIILVSTVKKPVVVLKNVQAFTPINNNIVWLGADGFLYRASESSVIAQTLKTPVTPEKLTTKALKINRRGVYKIINDGQHIFLNNNSQLLALNSKTKDFDILAENITDAKISPDGYNLVFTSGGKIYLYTLLIDGTRPYFTLKEKTLLLESKTGIKDFFWLNSDYLIFSSGNKVMISEIDFRGGANVITLPNEFKSPEIIFNRSENKLYIQSDKKVLISEKLVP